MTRPGLRARVAAGFAVGALLVSVAMAILSYQLTQRFLLAEREATALRASYLEAGIVSAGLATTDTDIAGVLRTLDTGGNRRAIIERDGQRYSRNADFGNRFTIPPALQELVASGHAGIQTVPDDSGPVLVIGIPVDASTGFYIIDSLHDLDQSLKTLAIILVLVAAATTAAGAALGWYAARRAVRPMTSIARTASQIARGDYEARLDPAQEPDLAWLSESFNDMVEQLSRRMQRDRTFAADVSHELRSPLQTLSAAADVLNGRKSRLDDRSAAAVGLLTSEVSRFENLVTDLLELARSDQPAEREPTDAAEVAQAVCRSRGLNPALVTTVPPGATPMWMLDRRRFRQVIANLADNAQRHGGGLTAITIRSTPQMLTVDVDDEGPGVSVAERELVFGRFVRGRTAGARGDSEGTGLGLALVFQHVTAHGGTVHVTDRPGGGARFRVELPAEMP